MFEGAFSYSSLVLFGDYWLSFRILGVLCGGISVRLRALGISIARLLE
jgi:hypothetical protein